MSKVPRWRGDVEGLASEQVEGPAKLRFCQVPPLWAFFFPMGESMSVAGVVGQKGRGEEGQEGGSEEGAWSRGWVRGEALSGSP